MCVVCVLCVVVFQAEDGIRDLVRSRGLGDVYKRQGPGNRTGECVHGGQEGRYSGRHGPGGRRRLAAFRRRRRIRCCLLYTSDAADERSRGDLGGPRLIKKKKDEENIAQTTQ